MRLFTLVALFLYVGLAPVFSQSFYAARRERNVIASIGTGSATYLGDLKNPGYKIDPKLNLNLGLQVFVTQRIALRTEVTWYHISATDKDANSDRRERNLSFFADNIEANVGGIFNFFPNRGIRYYRRSNFNVYAFAGIGVTFMNPKTTYQGKTVALQPLETEGIKYSRFQPIVPYGFGIKFKQSPVLNICIEAGYRQMFTDYLDDVSSTRYPADPSTLKSDLARNLSDRRPEYFESIGKPWVSTPNVGKRGNPKNNDSYFLLNIKVEYYLPYDVSVGKKLNRGKVYNPRRKYDFNKRRYRK